MSSQELIIAYSKNGAAGPFVSSALCSAAGTTGLSSGVIPRGFMISSILRTSLLSAERPRRTIHSAVKYLRMISASEALRQTLSSLIQLPAMFTPMSVGLLYGLSP